MEHGHDGAVRALVVVAHPDDLDFGAGGTIAAWTEQGIEVSYCVLTDGDAGGFDPEVPRAEIGGIRQAEQRAAAKELGVDDVVFLGYPDGYLQVTLDLRRDLTREVRRIRPDVVVAPDPSRLWTRREYVNHPDHRAVGEAMLAVVNPDAPSRPQFPELLDEGHEPYEVPELWIPVWEPERADRLVDVTAYIDKKIEALLAHDSQIRNMGVEDIAPKVRGRAARTAEGSDAEYAEAFMVFRLVELPDTPKVAGEGSVTVEEG